MGVNQSERGNGGVHVGFVLLVCGTAFDVLAYKLCKTWPPEFGGNELAGFEITRMTGGLVVIAMSDDGVMEEIIWGNVDTALVQEDVVVVFPVRETRPEGSRNILQG